MERPKVGLAVIIMHEDLVLLGKRKNAHGDGSYCFPGGHLEAGESFLECAKREIIEELGKDVKLKFIDKNPDAVTNDVFLEEDRHYITLFLRARYVGGEIRSMEPKKNEGWDWYRFIDLPKPLFLPIQNLIKQKYVPFRDLEQISEK